MAETYTAFVIDDDKEMRSSLSALLERAGWRAIQFSSAQSALDRLEIEAPDVDAEMPKDTNEHPG